MSFADYAATPTGIETLLPGIDRQFEMAASSPEKTTELQASLADYIAIAKFSSATGVPFCVESNPNYQSPHAVVHEMGHWAVKPDSYIHVYRALSRRDFAVVEADIVIDAPYGDPEVIPGVTYYPGNNDRMPDWDLTDGLDPTPNEKATRAWSQHVMRVIGLRDPIELTRQHDYATQGIGDSVVAKGASFRTWAHSAVNNPVAIRDFESFGMDPANGLYRPTPDSLVLPYETPTSISELIDNVDAMVHQHPDRTYAYPGQLEDWVQHATWKFKSILSE